jgi:uncharacterized protein YneF (UPF0154 family)
MDVSTLQITLVVLVLLISMCMGYIFMLKSWDRKLFEKLGEIKKANWKLRTSQLGEKPSSYSISESQNSDWQIRELQASIKSLQNENLNLREQISKLKKHQTQLNQVEVEVQDVSERVSRVFYLSMPSNQSDDSGSFKDLPATTIQPGISFYKFELSKDENHANFWFIDSPNTVKSALQMPDYILETACNYEGLHSKANKILTKKPGKVKKEGNNWKITAKAEISFK